MMAIIKKSGLLVKVFLQFLCKYTDILIYFYEPLTKMMITVINVTVFVFPALDLIDLKFQFCSAKAGKFYILKCMNKNSPHIKRVRRYYVRK